MFILLKAHCHVRCNSGHLDGAKDEKECNERCVLDFFRKQCDNCGIQCDDYCQQQCSCNKGLVSLNIEYFVLLPQLYPLNKL